MCSKNPLPNTKKKRHPDWGTPNGAPGCLAQALIVNISAIGADPLAFPILLTGAALDARAGRTARWRGVQQRRCVGSVQVSSGGVDWSRPRHREDGSATSPGDFWSTSPGASVYLASPNTVST